jgi:hypothetical protein
LDEDPESHFLEKKAFEELQRFYEDLWEKKKDPFSKVSIIRDRRNPVHSVDVSQTMEVLRIPNIFFPRGNIMVRDDYPEALEALEGHFKSRTKSVFIVGHPGIGRTMDSIRRA